MRLPIDHVTRALAGLRAPGSFSARVTRPAEDLLLEVKGVGPIDLPVSQEQASALCEVARPARYGRGEETLLDRSVRDAWEVPKSRVKIDRRSWNRTLKSVLDRLQGELGLPETGRLEAELHNLLVYGPGQFFLPHQDSEKDDEMIGTLVVVLPSEFRGGALTVEHQGQKSTYRGSKKKLSFVAFYADCLHEVRPITSGYRVALTYNLLFDGRHRELPSPGIGIGPENEPASLETALRTYFETPSPTYGSEEGETPRRLVYLLDHQYTERGLDWPRLKGADSARAERLRAAAKAAACRTALAAVEVREIWHAFGPDGSPYGSRGRYRSWQRDEDGWVEETPEDPDDYELLDFIDSEVVLTRWTGEGDAPPRALQSYVPDDQVCLTTPTETLKPFAQEYEGYMGNYGNTMDRWYRRAAVVVWPVEQTLALRAEADAGWALEELATFADPSEIRAGVRSLLPVWMKAVVHASLGKEAPVALLEQTLPVAVSVDEAELASSLIAPFPIEALTPRQAPKLAALAARHGASWVQALVKKMSSAPAGRGPYPHRHVADLPALVQALQEIDDGRGTPWAEAVVEERWKLTERHLNTMAGMQSPTLRTEEAETLPAPLLGLLQAAESLPESSVSTELVTALQAGRNGFLLLPIVEMIRRAEAKKEAASSPGLDTLREYCVRSLQDLLAAPPRPADDWSIDLPKSCTCELCDQLRTFLADPNEQRLEWRINTEKRKHVHQVIRGHELPVSHTTRRSGSPYTLLLAKKKDLFKREEQQRRTWREALARLSPSAPSS